MENAPDENGRLAKFRYPEEINISSANERRGANDRLTLFQSRL
jgi:hypothetical protein